MSGRGRSTFNKRQKEQKRIEKRLEKVARREQRKANGPEASETPIAGAEESGEAAGPDPNVANTDVSSLG